MSKKAYLVQRDGSKKLVNAGDFKSNYGNEFRCCGKDSNNNECLCHVRLIKGIKEESYFKVIDSDKHIPFCNNCEEGKGKIIAHLSRTTNLDLNTMLVNFNTPRGNDNVIIDPGELNPGGENIDGGDNIDDIDLNIHNTRKDPRNVRELYAILLTLNVDNTYAGQLVGDFCYNSRNLEQINEHGIALNRPVVTVARHTMYKDSPDLSALVKQGFTVAKFYCNGDLENPIYFAFHASTDAKNYIYKKAKGKSYAIFAIWVQSPQNPNIYICENTLQKKSFSVVEE
jgi:hypothetical protein